MQGMETDGNWFSLVGTLLYALPVACFCALCRTRTRARLQQRALEIQRAREAAEIREAIARIDAGTADADQLSLRRLIPPDYPMQQPRTPPKVKAFSSIIVHTCTRGQHI